MQIQFVPHLSVCIIAFCTVFGAIFGLTLIGLAVGLAAVIALTLLER